MSRQDWNDPISYNFSVLSGLEESKLNELGTARNYAEVNERFEWAVAQLRCFDAEARRPRPCARCGQLIPHDS